MESLVFSLNNTVPLFAVMVLGYVLKQKNFFRDAFIADANRLVFYVSLPVLLFLDMAQTDVRAAFDGPYLLFCLGATLASILLIWGGAHLFIRDKAQIGEFVQASYRSSAAILGTALISMIYGASGATGLMLLGSVPLYNIFAVLVLVLESPDPAAQGQPLGLRLKNSLRRILCNPILLGIFLGLAAGLLHLPLPAALASTLSQLSRLTMPLALLAIGAGFRGRAALGRLRLTTAAALITLLVLPALCLPLAVRFGFTGERLVGVLVMTGSITTPASYVMARQMGHEGTLTGSVCAATTLFSALTLTFWLFLCRALGWL